jgi:ABC-type nickel/cobalt efflux system permease component RcnA
MRYYLMMHLIKNRLLSLFVAFSVAFASLWAMSPDAIADAIQEEAMVYFNQHDQQQVAQIQHDQDHAAQNQTCNHGCHMAFHLLGFAATTTTNVFAFNESPTVFSYANLLLDNPHLQGPYRPPLTLSLV